eukprot:COSAG06_NODE_5827_length_3254_cov_3.707132_2_plen_238_part_00
MHRVVSAAVNDLLDVLSGFGGAGADGTDVNGDSTVDVNDLLSVLSDFGSSCGMAGGAPAEPAEVNCCGGGSACGYQYCAAIADDPATDVNEACVQPWGMPAGMSFDDCSGDAAPEPAACTMGSDCGGQVWNTCASSCPDICGQPGPMMCNMMCNQAYVCSFGECFNEASGACETSSGGGVLPPGVVPGRPFLTAKEAPLFARVVEHAVSDWVGLAGPDGKHNHDGRHGGDYGQEEEF